MSGRLPLPTLLALAVILALPGDGAAQTATTELSLRDRLVYGLQVRRPSEFDFVDAVVDSVERGDLPATLVDRFFLYARKKPVQRNRPRRPIIYFEFALRAAAEQLRLEIKPDPESTES